MTFNEFMLQISVIRKSTHYLNWCRFVKNLETDYPKIRFSLYGDERWVELYGSPQFKEVYNKIVKFKLSLS
jgi:hypothetical protein